MMDTMYCRSRASQVEGQGQRRSGRVISRGRMLFVLGREGKLISVRDGRCRLSPPSNPKLRTHAP